MIASGWEPERVRLVSRDVDVVAPLDRAAAAAGFHVPMPDGYEEKLVERLRRRDEAAFNELVRLYEAKIFRLVFRMIGDRAEAEEGHAAEQRDDHRAREEDLGA